MKIKLSIVLLFISAVAFGQNNDTPYVRPVAPTTMSSNYHFKQQLWVDSIMKARKAIFQDSVGFKGVVTAPTQSTTDSTNKTATTKFVKQVVAGISGGSGSIEYLTEGYGIKIDSSGRVYTVRGDSTVLTSHTRVQNIADTKQNLVTLTTTGSSGAATFNQSTGALNIPNYASGGGGGSAKAYSPLVVRNDSVYQRFNVLAYGAIDDSTTDCTRAIQAAINDCFAAGGGVVFFPKTLTGVYLISDTLRTWFNGLPTDSAQLIIPHTTYEGIAKQPMVKLMGESMPSPYNDWSTGAVRPTSGIVLKSTRTSTGGSIIGSPYATSLWGNWNYTFFQMENISLMVNSIEAGVDVAAKMTALNASHISMIDIQRCSFVTSSALDSSVQPLSNTYGIKMPPNLNFNNTTVRNVIIQGFYTGMNPTEHLNGDDISISGCYIALRLPTATHISYITKLKTWWNKFSIYVEGDADMTITQWDTETLPSSVAVKWYNDSLEFYEPTATGANITVLSYSSQTAYDPGNAVEMLAYFTSPNIILTPLGRQSDVYGYFRTKRIFSTTAYGNKLTFQNNAAGGGTTPTNIAFDFLAGNSGGLVSNVILNNGNNGIGISAPLNKLHVYSTTTSDGISVDGNNFPSIVLRSSGTIRGYAPAVVTSAAGFFSPSTAGDLAFRVEGAGKKIMFGNASSLTPAATISESGLSATKFYVSALNTAPSSASDTGTTGEIRITATYIYVCTATNTWVRTALATW